MHATTGGLFALHAARGFCITHAGGDFTHHHQFVAAFVKLQFIYTVHAVLSLKVGNKTLLFHGINSLFIAYVRHQRTQNVFRADSQTRLSSRVPETGSLPEDARAQVTVAA